MTPERTMMISREEIHKEKMRLCLMDIVQALEEKGYDPISQISGYLMTGDPAYITSYKNARSKIQQFQPSEIVEMVLKEYIEDSLGKPSKAIRRWRSEC